jgi:hypothetical protein
MSRLSCGAYNVFEKDEFGYSRIVAVAIVRLYFFNRKMPYPHAELVRQQYKPDPEFFDPKT